MKNIKDIVNEANLIDKETGAKVLGWMEASWSVTIVDPNNSEHPVKTLLFKNCSDTRHFLKTQEPNVYKNCPDGPSISDIIDDMDSSDDVGSSMQFCYDDKNEEPWKYYIVSKIINW